MLYCTLHTLPNFAAAKSSRPHTIGQSGADRHLAVASTSSSCASLIDRFVGLTNGMHDWLYEPAVNLYDGQALQMPIAQEIIDRCLRLQAEEPVDIVNLA